MSTFNDKLRSAALALESGEQTEIRIPFFGIDQLPGGMVKYTPAYLRVTMNRAISSGKITVRKDNDYFDEDERPTPGYLITYEAGDGEAKPKRGKRQGKTYSDGVAEMAAFVPDIVDYTPEELAATQKILKAYREHAARLIGGEA